MNLTPFFSSPCFRRRARAFTLSEMMVVMAIFSMLVVALVACQIFGMRLKAISETKLGATASGRRALNQVRNEIRSGKILTVGTGDNVSFMAIAANSFRTGNAMQINPTTNRNTFIRYYLDQNDNSLKRITSFNGQPEVLASFITNRLVFQAEDYRGNVMTNDQNNHVVIRMILEFYRWEYPLATAGNGGMYDYYRLQTRIARRTID